MNNIQLNQAFQLQNYRLERLQSQRTDFDQISTKSKITLKKMLSILDEDVAKFTQKHEELIMNIKVDDRIDFEYFEQDISGKFERAYIKLYSDIEQKIEDSNDKIDEATSSNNELIKLLSQIN